MAEPDDRRRPIKAGDLIRLPDSAPDWFEFVVGFGPDGRMITVDPANRVQRYSDPTEHWEFTTNRPPQFRPNRGFRAKGKRS